VAARAPAVVAAVLDVAAGATVGGEGWEGREATAVALLEAG
jgi:hypothetical protein